MNSIEWFEETAHNLQDKFSSVHTFKLPIAVVDSYQMQCSAAWNLQSTLFANFI